MFLNGYKNSQMETNTQMKTDTEILLKFMNFFKFQIQNDNWTSNFDYKYADSTLEK